MKKPLVGLLGLCALCLSAGAAHAGIVSTGGSISVIAPPAVTVAHNAVEANGVVQVWFESAGSIGAGGQTFTDSGLTLGQRNSPGSANITSNTVAAGTPYESFFIHFDVVGTTATSISNAGTSLEINFSAPIIGIEFSRTGLANTDAAFGGSVTYSNQNGRGLELSNNPAERYTIFNNGRSIRIDDLRNETGVPSDSLRVIISPEPSSLALMGLGIVGFGAFLRRRRRRTAVRA